MSALTYYPQRTQTDCLLTGLECLLQRPREDLGDLAYYEGGFLSYGSVSKVLNTQPRPFRPILRDFTPHLWRENIPMILGIRMKGHLPGTPLHCVFWDGSWAWEPYTQVFLSEDMREMKVAYAIGDADQMRFNREVGALEWFDRWDDACKERNENGTASQERAKTEESAGPAHWLEVVG